MVGAAVGGSVREGVGSELGEDVALFRGSEAALRRERHLIERNELCGFVDTPLDVILCLKRADLRRDETKHDDLVAIGQKAQRLEPARPL